MPDPITAGSAVAAALQWGATALAKNLLSSAAKDLYEALKARVAAWSAPTVAALEERVRDDKSTALQSAAVAEVVDEQADAERAAAEALAEQLLALLRDEGGAPPAGISVSDGGIVVTGTLNVGGDVAGRDLIKDKPTTTRKR